MPLVSLSDLPPKGALLGLDPGTTGVGVAACDAYRLMVEAVSSLVL